MSSGIFQKEIASNMSRKALGNFLGAVISECIEEGRNQKNEHGITYSVSTETDMTDGILVSCRSVCNVGGVLAQHHYHNACGKAGLTTYLSNPFPKQVDPVQRLIFDNLVARYQRFYGKAPEVREPEVVP